MLTTERARGAHAATRSLAILALLCACVSIVSAQTLSWGKADADQSELTQRVLQYELVLGKPLDPEVGICMDNALGRRGWRWTAGGQSDDPSGQAVAAIRRTHEDCLVPTLDTTFRAVADMQKGMERTLEKAALREKLEQGRKCLQSPDLDALRSCVTSAEGRPLPEAVWQVWTRLYRLATNP